VDFESDMKRWIKGNGHTLEDTNHLRIPHHSSDQRSP
jgi:hypothetical protein